MSSKQCHSSQPPPKQQPKAIPSALQVFSKTRDTDSSTPYHLDGDIQMYSEQKLQQRSILQNDPDIRKQLQNLIRIYKLTDGKIIQKQYKRIQKKIALILRPEIQQDELQFIVDEDWKLDSKSGSILPQQMITKIFQLVDIWTIGTDKQQYLSFTKVLTKKLQKSLKQQSNTSQ